MLTVITVHKDDVLHLADITDMHVDDAVVVVDIDGLIVFQFVRFRWKSVHESCFLQSFVDSTKGGTFQVRGQKK